MEREGNQQAGATKAGIHDLISQFILGREKHKRPTGGQKYMERRNESRKKMEPDIGIGKGITMNMKKVWKSRGVESQK